MENELDGKKLTAARETAAALSVSEKTLWNYTQPRGPIPSYRIGSRVLYDLKEAIEAIKQKRRPKSADEIADEVSDMLGRNPMLRTINIDTERKGGEV